MPSEFTARSGAARSATMARTTRNAFGMKASFGSALARPGVGVVAGTATSPEFLPAPVASLEPGIDRSKLAEIGPHPVARRDRIEPGASAGRDDLVRHEAAPLRRLLVGEPQQHVHRVA